MRAILVLAFLGAAPSVAAADKEPETFPKNVPENCTGGKCSRAAPQRVPSASHPDWVTPKTPQQGLDIPQPTQGLGFVDRPKISYTPAIIATSTTAALLALSVASYLKYEAVHKRSSTANDTDPLNEPGADIDEALLERQDALDSTARWKHISIGIFAATVISGGVTGYMWSRHDYQPKGIRVEPANSGVRIAYSGSF